MTGIRKQRHGMSEKAGYDLYHNIYTVEHYACNKCFVGHIGRADSVMMVVVTAMAMVVVMMVIGSMPVVVIMLVSQMNIEFHPGNSRFFLARNVEVIAIEPQFLQLMLEAMRINAKIQQRRHKHIAADPAEDIEVKDFHKFQAPSSKLQRSSNRKVPNARPVTERFDFWNLELLWSLKLGIWNFINQSKH